MFWASHAHKFCLFIITSLDYFPILLSIQFWLIFAVGKSLTQNWLQESLFHIFVENRKLTFTNIFFQKHIILETWLVLKRCWTSMTEYVLMSLLITQGQSVWNCSILNTCQMRGLQTFYQIDIEGWEKTGENW